MNLIGVRVVSASLFVLLIASYANAQSVEVCRLRTTVVHVNGILTTQFSAHLSMRHLEERLRPRIAEIEEKLMSFALAYNNSVDAFNDLDEAREQYDALDWRLLWRMLAGLEPMPDSLREDVAAILARDFSFGPEVFEHVSRYQGMIASGEAVILVPHSQGNFFATLAHGLLSPTEQAATDAIGVATPTAPPYFSGKYVTLTNDRVIQLVSLRQPVNPPNETNAFTFIDWSNHSFVDTYLMPGSKSHENILTKVTTAVESKRSIDGCSIDIQPMREDRNGVEMVFAFAGDRFPIEARVLRENDDPVQGVQMVLGSDNPHVADVVENELVAKKNGLTRLTARSALFPSLVRSIDLRVSGDQFYWAHGLSEALSSLADVQGWIYDRIDFRVFDAPSPTRVPLYRFFDRASWTHFWTRDAGGEEFLSNFPQAIPEGPKGYVGFAPSGDTVPVYRWYNPTTQAHFWSTNAGGEGVTAGFVSEGVAFYAPPAAAGAGTAVHRLKCPNCLD